MAQRAAVALALAQRDARGMTAAAAHSSGATGTGLSALPATKAAQRKPTAASRQQHADMTAVMGVQSQLQQHNQRCVALSLPRRSRGRGSSLVSVCELSIGGNYTASA